MRRVLRERDAVVISDEIRPGGEHRPDAAPHVERHAGDRAIGAVELDTDLERLRVLVAPEIAHGRLWVVRRVRVEPEVADRDALHPVH